MSTIDTIPGKCFRLTEKQIHLFTNKWNHSEHHGMVKNKPLYHVTIYQNDSTVRNFRANGKLIKENGDNAFKIDDALFFERIWDELDKDHIENIKSVFDEYVWSNESTDSPGNKALMESGLKALCHVKSPHNLELLLNVWMYYDPTDFPTRQLVEEVLIFNKQESVTAIKSRQKNKREKEHDGAAPFSELNRLMEQIEK